VSVVGRNCVDSTSTSYGLKGPEFEYRKEQGISSSSKSSKTALIQWVPWLYPGGYSRPGSEVNQWPPNLKFSIPKCYNIQINTTRLPITQLLRVFCIQWYIWEGRLFRRSRSSSGPPRKQIQLLDPFSWRAWGWPTMSKHVALTYIPLYIK